MSNWRKEFEAFLDSISTDKIFTWQKDFLMRFMQEKMEGNEPGPFASGKKVSITVLDTMTNIPVKGFPPEMPEDAARGLLMKLVEDWPQFDTDEPVNGSDAVEYLEGVRDDARKLLGIPIPMPPVDQPPMAFEYYEVRPCIQVIGDDEVESFVTEEECAAREDECLKKDLAIRKFYTLYGRYPDVDGGLLAIAIGDFTFKRDAMEVMNAILAPMAKARDELREGLDKSRAAATMKDGVNILERTILQGDAILDDVINQSSNGERP